MPYVNLVTNVTVSEEKENKIVDVIGNGITVIEGKIPDGLFIKIEGDCKLYSRGIATEANAMITVDVFGYSKEEEFAKYATLIKGVLYEELGITAEHLYINFKECRNWYSRGELSTAFSV